MAIYLKIDGLNGEVTAAGHEKWIECSAMQWGVGRGISTPTGSSSNRESSTPSISEVTVTKMMDCATADLFKEACVGQSKSAKIHLVQTGADKPEQYMEYDLTEVLISGYSVAAGNDGRPSESVSLNFTKVQMKYTEFDNKHKPKGSFTSGYDIATGKKL